MFEIPKVLSADELAAIHAELASGVWEDGRATAGGLARHVKRNEQLRSPRQGSPCEQRIARALLANELFASLTFARRVSTPFINRYRAGMEYGTHIDNPLVAGESPLRADVSVTVFLSDPDAYEGGHLVAETPAGEVEFKLPAGHAVVYPASTLHRVEPVTRGERIAAVCWVQSSVRDPAVREILTELSAALALVARDDPRSEAALRLARARANLLRMHAEA